MTTLSLNDWAADWVRKRGVAPAGPLAERTLIGGISSTVVAVDGPTGGVVVKGALEVLRVDAEWRADPRRSLTEPQALVAIGAELGSTLAAWHRGTRMPWPEVRNFKIA
jgi:hypothetical protein